jgi:hypothetical protein
MKPIKFNGMNVTFAEGQPEYLSLPAYKLPNDQRGTVVTCWGLSFFEKIKLLFTGKLYITSLTFNNALTPLLPEIDLPQALKNEGD